MPNIKITCKNGTVEIDADIIKKFSKFITNADVSVDATVTQVTFIKEYCEHHQHAEAPVSLATVTLGLTLAAAFSPDPKDAKDKRDAWDAEFLTRVIESESDSFLIDFSRVVLLFDMETLRQKVTKAIAIAVVAKANTLKPDKLAEEFNKLALKVK